MTNIITATFGCGTSQTTNPAYQYDYGQVLKIAGLNLPQYFEAHFCNQGQGTTVTQIGENNEVIIPDAVFQSPVNILCYIYLHTGEDDGETEYKITIPIIARAKPTNQTPTPVQQDAITQAIAALNEGVEVSTAQALKAEGYAVGEQNGEPVSSGTYFENNAKYYSEQAGASATNAHDSELAAAQSEHNAAQSETNAYNSELNADLSEASAEASALKSEGYAVGTQNGAPVQSGDYFQNNAKYYADVAGQAAGSAGYLDIYIDENGHLIYTRTDQVDVDFVLVDGHLIMEVI